VTECSLLCGGLCRTTTRRQRVTTHIAFTTSDFPSVLKGFLHTEQHYITPASPNAHNIGIFLAPAHSKPALDIRRSGCMALRCCLDVLDPAPNRQASSATIPVAHAMRGIMLL
jgi:hypothetical protein